VTDLWIAAMELQDFITKTLLSITRGVENANRTQHRFHLNRKKYSDGTSGEEVEFNVQVIATETGEKNAESGISISVASLGSAKLGGDLKPGHTNQNTHSLKFSVFVSES
jgi:hypothetical protein